ncbi:MAG: PA0069 family radical SAM protein [Rhodocyclaceae bacterium]|nr:PA0069 family radical SAM protein [Rhodocyclaceae bacterium]
MSSDLFPDPDDATSPRPQKGRGTSVNPDSRFAAWTRAAVDDGWRDGTDAAESARVPTELFVDSAKTIISHNDSPDLPFDRSVNPYRGCEHGCIYCYARASHAYLGHSAGLDFESKLYHKPEAAKLLRRELGKPGYQCRPLAIGTNTDAWQPVERRLRLTRAMLEVLWELKHPALLITKSALIERDLDLLAAMARENLVHAAVSLTTLDGDLARRLEPRAAAPQARLAAIEKLVAAGVPVTVMVAPIIPGLTDHELERILAAAREAGASAAAYSLLRLPRELHDLFERWLSWHAPEKAARVMAVLYDMRGGQSNDARFTTRMHGLGHFADLLAQRFALHQRRLGYSTLPPLDCSRFVGAVGTRGRATGDSQLDLF